MISWRRPTDGEPCDGEVMIIGEERSIFVAWRLNSKSRVMRVNGRRERHSPAGQGPSGVLCKSAPQARSDRPKSSIHAVILMILITHHQTFEFSRAARAKSVSARSAAHGVLGRTYRARIA